MASIFFRTALIYILLSFAMKLMGKRQIGELEVGELISALLISEICSIPIDDSDIPLLNAVIPVFLIVSLEIIISYFKNKSSKLKRLFDGDSVFLIKDGVFMQKALKDNRISIEEFFIALRQNGVGNLGDVENCILEANGKISVLQKSNGCEMIVISDGEIIDDAISKLNIKKDDIISACGGTPEKVFLMTADKSGINNIILKEGS